MSRHFLAVPGPSRRRSLHGTDPHAGTQLGVHGCTICHIVFPATATSAACTRCSGLDPESTPCDHEGDNRTSIAHQVRADPKAALRWNALRRLWVRCTRDSQSHYTRLLGSMSNLGTVCYVLRRGPALIRTRLLAFSRLVLPSTRKVCSLSHVCAAACLTHRCSRC